MTWIEKTLSDVEHFEFVSHDNDGSLIAIESNDSIPFEVKRIFYVSGVETLAQRGQHAHYKTEQVLICLRGKITVRLHDGKNGRKYTLDNPTKGLYIPNGIWDAQVYHTDDTILLSLCSTLYDKEDYLEDFKEFQKLKKTSYSDDKGKK